MDIDPLPSLLILLDAVSFGAPQIVALCFALVALLLSAFMSGSEIAFFSLTPQQIEELDEEDSVTLAIRKLLAMPERLRTARERLCCSARRRADTSPASTSPSTAE